MRHDIKTTVDKIVSKYNTRDPYELCDYMNVLLQIGDLGSALGCYLLIKRQKCIILNERILRTPLEKVVLSHELGHSNMHWKNDCYFYGSTLFSKSKEENEANSFAAELLVPDDLIYEHPGMTKNQIARILGYDERIMEFKKIY
ncbi:Metallopeptidase immA [[Eubacterium] contortum]|uniref:Metallopeptidase immA n=1 Tax=Faecalicatena contorta TaxID=39482 RepID=A0A174CZU4_9FIRM|nr:ImmA/IrrE family metallo-endopeptidase [Faecalicatena contorta]CUO18922.1 Metallopeptidase immA [[Eubacterium] contortum] [Faecalicatena contorta]